MENYSHAEIDNALVSQKDTILACLNADEVEQAARLLSFAAPLWYAAGYGYKIKEVGKRIVDAAVASVELWRIAGRTKNNRTNKAATLRIGRLAEAEELARRTVCLFCGYGAL